MTEFGKLELTTDAAALDHRDIWSIEHTLNHRCLLLTLFKRFSIHKGGIDIARPVLREYDQQEEWFHIRDWGIIVGLQSLVFGLSTNEQRLTTND